MSQTLIDPFSKTGEEKQLKIVLDIMDNVTLERKHVLKYFKDMKLIKGREEYMRYATEIIRLIGVDGSRVLTSHFNLKMDSMDSLLSQFLLFNDFDDAVDFTDLMSKLDNGIIHLRM